MKKKQKADIIERTIAPDYAFAPEANTLPPILIGNACHIGNRESQQDSFAISNLADAALYADKGVLCVVADGMGGMADGAEISALAVQVMQQYFSESAVSGEPAQTLLNMVVAANASINRFMEGRSRGGSTVVAIIIHKGKLHWISVGDSRIYLLRNGAIIQLNTEHIYLMDLAERVAVGEMTWEEAQNDPQRNALTSYLGIGQLEKIDRNLQPMDLLGGDQLLLMSDGVFGTLSNEEILGAMTPYPHSSAQELQAKVLAKQKPNQDNLTAVVVQYLGCVLI